MYSHSVYIWINRGLLFVGGCEDKDLQKPMDDDPSDGANEGWGGRSLSRHGDRFAQRTPRQQQMKICHDLSNNKNMVFNLKKLLSYRMDLMPRRIGPSKTMRAE
jgi:hypothetical protein